MKLEAILFVTALLFSITLVGQEAPPPPPPPPPPSPSEVEVFKVVEQMPNFPGCDSLATYKEQSECGSEKLLKYIYANLKYPKKARMNGVEGMAVVQFVVSETGSLEDVKVIRDPGAGCGEAAAKVIESMNDLPEKWKPGMQRGRYVKVLYTLPVKFKLDNPKPKPVDILNDIVTKLEGDCECIGKFRSLSDLYNMGYISLDKNGDVIGLNFQFAGLRGYIPYEINRFEKLQWINLEYNYLTGRVPDNLYKLPELEELLLTGNNLEIVAEKEVNKSRSLKIIDDSKNVPLKVLPSNRGMIPEIEEVLGKVPVVHMPRFPGCEDEETEKESKNCANSLMLQFIYKTLRYPAKARELRVQGTVVVQFVVMEDGTIANIDVKKNIGHGCGAAAKWVVTRMNHMEEKWIPGKDKAENPIPTLYTLPVRFKLQ